MSRDRQLDSLAKVVFVTGKGGVGKTTVASALALDAKRRKLPALLVEFGDGESGERVLGPMARELEHRVIRFDDSLLDTVSDMLGSRTLAKVFVGHSAMRRLIRAAPGIAELIKLDALRRLADERQGRIVVDLPASGHALGWLRVATSISRFARVGPLHDIAERIDALVRDRARSSIVVVTIPESLVLKETADLCRALVEEVGRGADFIAINRVPTADPEGAIDIANRLAPQLDAARAIARILDARRASFVDARRAIADIIGQSQESVIEFHDSPTDPTPSDLQAWLS